LVKWGNWIWVCPELFIRSSYKLFFKDTLYFILIISN